ncbi:MAG: hypothetical protein WAQ75_09350 [Propionicimonas sp.]
MKFRISGISVGNAALQAGIQFEPKDDDREVARRVLNNLGDRRMLWKDFTNEVEEHCADPHSKCAGNSASNSTREG